MSTRTALITGSGQNIGRGIAMHLAQSGHNVVINGSSNQDACDAVANEARSAGAQALVVMADIGKRSEAEAMAAEAIKAFGRVDILINNAAIRPNGDFLNMGDEAWNRVIDVNLNSAVWLCRACLPGMIEGGYGRIVNFTGMHAQQGYGGKPHVSVSKHALWGLTKALAKEYGTAGITTNIVSPGTIVGENAGHSAEIMASMLATNPVGRLGTPDDIASMVDLLVSEGGGFINGQLLQVNGGVIT